MTVIDDDELETDIRASLTAWAELAPISDGQLEHFETPTAVRRRSLRILAAAAVLVAVAITAALLPRTDDSTPTIAGPGAPPDRIAVGKQTGVRAIAAADDGMWLMSSNDRTLFRIDPETRQVDVAHELDGYFEGVAVGDGLVWLSGYEPTRVVAVDAVTGEIVRDIPIDFDPWGVELAFGAAWIGGGGDVTRIDVDTGEVSTYDLGMSTGFITATDDALWVANPEDESVTAVDPSSGDIVTTVGVGGEPRGLAISPEGDLWVTLPSDNAVVRVDTGDESVDARVDVGLWPDAIAFVGDEAWVTTREEGTITRIARDEPRVLGVHPVGHVPVGIVNAFGRVWVSLHQEAAVLAIDPSEPLLATPAPSFAGEVDDVYLRCRGSGDATVMLVQDARKDTGAMPLLEALLAARTRVCIADTDRARDLRAALERANIPGPFVVVGHETGGAAARELAASWDEVTGLILLDTNTVEAPVGESIDVPIIVAASDADIATDEPRVGTPDERKRWTAAHATLAKSLGARFVVVRGDPWTPTYRPDVVADLILGMI